MSAKQGTATGSGFLIHVDGETGLILHGSPIRGTRGRLRRSHTEIVPTGDCYMRIERKGSRITGSSSIDGTKWKELKPIDTVWPTKLKLGLTAITTSSEPFTVKFEDFVLKQK